MLTVDSHQINCFFGVRKMKLQQTSLLTNNNGIHKNYLFGVLLYEHRFVIERINA